MTYELKGDYPYRGRGRLPITFRSEGNINLAIVGVDVGYQKGFWCGEEITKVRISEYMYIRDYLDDRKIKYID